MTLFPDATTAQTLQAMPDAVIAVDSNGKIRFLNSAAENLTGYINDELLDKSVDVLVPTSRRKAHGRLRSHYQQAPSSRQMGARADLQMRKKNGDLLPVTISLSPLVGYDDYIVLSTIRDVSAQERRSREEILVSELGRLVNSDRDIRSVYDAVAESVPILIKYDRLAINLYQPETGLVRREFVSGVLVAGGEIGTEVLPPTSDRTSPGPTPGTSLAGRPVGSGAFSEAVSAIGLNSWVEVPLGNPLDPFGHLSLRSFEMDAYDDDDLRILEKVSAQISPAIENAHLYAQAREEARESAVLAEVSRIITSTSEIEKVYSLVADQIREIVQFDRIVVATIDRARNLVTDRYVAGLLVDGGVADVTYPLDDSTVGEMGDDPHPRWLEKTDIEALGHRYPEEMSRFEAGLNSMLTVPLIWNDEMIGRIIFRSKVEKAYGEVEAAIATRVANQISGAVANAEMVTRLRRESAERAALAEIGRVVGSELDLQVVYQTVAEEVKSVIPHGRMAITSIDRDNSWLRREFVSGIECEGAGVGSTVLMSGDHAGYGLDDLGPAFGAYTPQLLTKLNIRGFGINSFLRAPLTIGGERFGYLSLEDSGIETFDSHDLALLERIAQIIAPAIENAKLYEAATRESEERAALAEIGRIVTSDADINRVYDEFAQTARRLIPFDRVIVAILDSDRENVVDTYIGGIDVSGVKPGRSISFAGSAAEELISQELPQRFDRDEMAAWAARHPEIRPGPLAGLQNMLVARLSWGGATNGLLVMTALDANAYDDSHVELAAQIADQISGAISNAGSHEAALQAEEERHASEARESELQALNEQRSNFLSTVSHELKTPLTSLLAFADLLARNRGTNLSERQLQQINVMQRSARRLDVLINDLLDVSKLDAGTFSLSKSEFDVEALLEEIAASFAPIVQQKHQKLNIVQGADPIWLCSDRDRVAQVVINLLSNASKYSGEDSVITLGTFAANGKLTFTIKDAGIGMSKEDQKRLFTPFFRASDDATQAEPGSGLGLVIVKSIVELHGGEISLESEPGVGTTVSVTFAECSNGPTAAHLESERAAAEPIIPHSRLDEIPANTLGN